MTFNRPLHEQLAIQSAMDKLGKIQGAMDKLGWDKPPAHKANQLLPEQIAVMAEMDKAGWGQIQSSQKRQVAGSHYQDMAIEPWEVMEACLTAEEFRGFLKGNVIKYALRAAQAKKPGWEEDGAKGKHYIARLAEMLSEPSS